MRPHISTITAVAFAVLTAAPSVGWAQNPSADQMINQLKPTAGGMGGGLTRGIRPAAPSTPTAPPATSPPSSGQQQAVVPMRPVPPNSGSRTQTAPAAPTSQAGVNLTVEFRSGSADLTPQAVHTLDELGRALSSSQLAAYRFRIEGHTDTVGTPESNKALSQRRATTVVDYIVTHFKVDRSRLEPVGMGEDGLLVTTPDQTPEPRNRRVQVVNIGA